MRSIIACLRRRSVLVRRGRRQWGKRKAVISGFDRAIMAMTILMGMAPVLVSMMVIWLVTLAVSN